MCACHVRNGVKEYLNSNNRNLSLLILIGELAQRLRIGKYRDRCWARQIRDCCRRRISSQAPCDLVLFELMISLCVPAN